MHNNEAIQISYKQVKMTYSLPRAYAVLCGRLTETVT